MAVCRKFIVDYQLRMRRAKDVIETRRFDVEKRLRDGMDFGRRLFSVEDVGLLEETHICYKVPLRECLGQWRKNEISNIQHVCYM